MPRLLQGHSRAIGNEIEKMSGVTHRFDQKWAFRGSEWARWLRLVAFLFGNGIKCHGHRQTLANRPCVAQASLKELDAAAAALLDAAALASP